MKKIALLFILLFPLLFSNCKKETENPDANIGQTSKANIVLLNISDSTPYSILSTSLPNEVILPPGGTIKEYTLDETRNITFLFANNVNIDTAGVTMPLNGNTESVFVMYDGSDARCKGSTTACYSPQKGKAIVRYINVSGFQKMEVKDNQGTIAATFNSTELPTRFWVDTIPDASAVSCTQFAAGKYSFDVYNDVNPVSPAYTKTNVSIESDKVYFVYLNGKKELKIIKR